MLSPVSKAYHVAPPSSEARTWRLANSPTMRDNPAIWAVSVGELVLESVVHDVPPLSERKKPFPRVRVLAFGSWRPGFRPGAQT